MHRKLDELIIMLALGLLTSVSHRIIAIGLRPAFLIYAMLQQQQRICQVIRTTDITRKIIMCTHLTCNLKFNKPKYTPPKICQFRLELTETIGVNDIKEFTFVKL